MHKFWKETLENPIKRAEMQEIFNNTIDPFIINAISKTALEIEEKLLKLTAKGLSVEEAFVKIKPTLFYSDRLPIFSDEFEKLCESDKLHDLLDELDELLDESSELTEVNP
ncbi:MAG: hypothetical protein FWG64_02390 [Firmicutes bacterium]|nr:hypothetical protein [Bacillota bacterium]